MQVHSSHAGQGHYNRQWINKHNIWDVKLRSKCLELCTQMGTPTRQILNKRKEPSRLDMLPCAHLLSCNFTLELGDLGFDGLNFLLGGGRNVRCRLRVLEWNEAQGGERQVPLAIVRLLFAAHTEWFITCCCYSR